MLSGKAKCRHHDYVPVRLIRTKQLHGMDLYYVYEKQCKICNKISILPLKSYYKIKI